MTASDATLAERAAAPSRSVEGDGPPDAQMRAGPLTIRHLGREPCVHPDAYYTPRRDFGFRNNGLDRFTDGAPPRISFDFSP